MRVRGRGKGLFGITSAENIFQLETTPPASAFDITFHVTVVEFHSQPKIM